MNRRDFAFALCTTGLLPGSTSAAVAAPQASGEPGSPTFAMLIHPKMILLDLVGPLTTFNMAMGQTHLVWKDPAPVSTDVGVPVAATATFADCPRDVDVLFVPGGLAGTTDLLGGSETIAFLREMGGRARFVTGVCTGTLLLGAAGLLTGRRATSHWYTRDMLRLFGAVPTEARVVEDGNVVIGGTTTAGLDFGLVLAAKLRGEDAAKRIQLLLEYDPQPPFDAGNPKWAGAALTADVLQRRKAALDAAWAAAERAAARMRD